MAEGGELLLAIGESRQPAKEKDATSRQTIEVLGGAGVTARSPTPILFGIAPQKHRIQANLAIRHAQASTSRKLRRNLHLGSVVEKRWRDADPHRRRATHGMRSIVLSGGQENTRLSRPLTSKRMAQVGGSLVANPRILHVRHQGRTRRPGKGRARRQALSRFLLSQNPTRAKRSEPSSTGIPAKEQD